MPSLALAGWFKLDAAGAALSAVLLGIMLLYYQPMIGMPFGVLYLLAFIPICFLVFDIVCLPTLPVIQPVHLRRVGLANAIYCVVSIVFLLVHWPSLTALGLCYFIGEIVIVSLLSWLELRQ